MSAQTYRTRAGAAVERHGKYQLDVTARDVVEVVRQAGGWLYDRAMAGWDVTVLVEGHCDVTPLRILGVRTERPAADEDPAAPPRSRALAVSASVMASNPHLHDEVLRELKRGYAEVTIWGDLGASGLERRVEPADHTLSAAARAFKGHALRAAGCDDAPCAVESFLRRETVFPTA